MKVCPTCRKTYSDDGLNFCLEDGSVLTFAAPDAPETVRIPHPMATNPNPGSMQQPSLQTSWGQTPQYSIQPQRSSSRSWLWIVGVIGIVLLLCGGGMVGFFVIAVMNADPANNSVTNSSTTEPTPGTTPKSDDRTDVQRVDLSEWVRETSGFGTTEYTGGEFLMAARQKGYYYVLVAPAEYKTESAKTSVTVRNVDDSASSLGYGLIFLSNPKPLVQGYAFLIDTQRKKYRVVRHEPKKETIVVNWTNSAAIKDGKQENILEADHKNDLIELRINGQSVTSIRNVHGYQGGVAGLYSGDAARIGFKNLEIRR